MLLAVTPHFSLSSLNPAFPSKVLRLHSALMCADGKCSHVISVNLSFLCTFGHFCVSTIKFKNTFPAGSLTAHIGLCHVHFASLSLCLCVLISSWISHVVSSLSLISVLFAVPPSENLNLAAKSQSTFSFANYFIVLKSWSFFKDKPVSSKMIWWWIFTDRCFLCLHVSV